MINITIIMSVSQTAQWMGDALQSILDSKVSIEVLVRACGRHEINEIGRHAGLLNKVRAILCDNHDHMFLSQSLNYMVGLAEGKYIMRLDPDDILEVDALEKMVFQLDDMPSEVFAYGDYQDFTDSGRGAIIRCKDATAQALWKHSVGPYNFLARTDFVREVGWREVGYEDWNMYIRLLAAGGQPLPLDMISLLHRVRGDGRGAVLGLRHEQMLDEMREENEKFFKENGCT